jgi:hypothetical protein
MIDGGKSGKIDTNFFFKKNFPVNQENIKIKECM